MRSGRRSLPGCTWSESRRTRNGKSEPGRSRWFIRPAMGAWVPLGAPRPLPIPPRPHRFVGPLPPAYRGPPAGLSPNQPRWFEPIPRWGETIPVPAGAVKSINTVTDDKNKGVLGEPIGLGPFVERLSLGFDKRVGVTAFFKPLQQGRAFTLVYGAHQHPI